MSFVYAAYRIEAQLSAGVWTSLGADVVNMPAPTWRRGQSTNGPLDRVAPTGTLEFSLRNDAGNTGGIQAWYSPNSASCRSGWTYGIPVRVVSTYQSIALGDGSPVDRVLWRGKVTNVLPDPGKYRSQRVHVTAKDCMEDLATNELVSVSPQVNQTEVQILQAIIAALPSTAQPPATSYDTALDTYPYALDNIGGQTKALSAASDVVISAWGRLYPKADGTLRYDNRHTLSTKSSGFTFTELTHDDVQVPSDLANVYNRIRVTIHPRTIDAAATTVFCSTVGSVAIGPGQTVEIFDTYRDPTNTLKLIGGTGFATVTAVTDYTANASADGTGTDMTASLSVTATTFAASVKWSITNTSSTTVYVTTRQLRGKGIYDNAPVTFESYTAEPYGDRPLPVDLPYQPDANIAQDLADYIGSLYALLADQATVVGLNPQRSDALLTQALTREIGDIVTDSETMTGLNAVQLVILGVQMTVLPGQILQVAWTVAPAGTGLAFLFDDATHGVFDSALSPLGYA